jgi:hypothetical protein
MTSFLQELLDQARAHDKRVVLLWFGTWKNTSPSYTPAWVKLNNARFPRMKDPQGKDHGVLSPAVPATMEADRRAFVKVMDYLRDHDRQNTVIMVQPENETGSYRVPRDFSAEGNRLFAQTIPAALARKTGKSGTWAQAFGAQAPRAFNTWYVASYVNALAQAGKAVKPLPMYVNASLAGPSNVPDPAGVASGGPQWDVLDIWAAAPAIDLAAPDIYDRASGNVIQYLDKYARRQCADGARDRQCQGIRALFLADHRARGHRLFALWHGCQRLFQLSAGRQRAGPQGACRFRAALCHGERHHARLGEDRRHAPHLGHGQARQWQ